MVSHQTGSPRRNYSSFLKAQKNSAISAITTEAIQFLVFISKRYIKRDLKR
jgi:hypothetical protein